MSIGIRGGYCGIITSNVVLSSAGGVTSSLAINLEYAKGNFSVQVDASGTAPNFDLTYRQSNDDVSYYLSSSGDLGIIISSAPASNVFSFAPSCCKSIKIYATNNNATSALTITKSTIFFNEK